VGARIFTKDKLIRFLKTREGHGVGTGKKSVAEVGRIVRRCLKREQQEIEKNPDVDLNLKDPEGGCVYRYLIQKCLPSHDDYPQQSDGKAPQNNMPCQN
jgi:hypothetical protein